MGLTHALIRELHAIERDKPLLSDVDPKTFATLREHRLVRAFVGETLAGSMEVFANSDGSISGIADVSRYGWKIWLKPTDAGSLVLEAFKIGRSVGHVEREP